MECDVCCCDQRRGSRWSNLHMSDHHEMVGVAKTCSLELSFT